jgi:LPS-assembly protein
LSSSLYLGRYQSFQSTTGGDEVRILHVPSLQAAGVDQPLANTGAYWGYLASAAEIKRSEPGLDPGESFRTGSVVRLDLYPHLAWPLHFAGWNLRPEAAFRETYYSKSQTADLAGTRGGLPLLRGANLNRLAGEASLDLRPPALERDYAPGWLHRRLRHVLEPDVQYRFVGGIDNFQSILRFDITDTVSNTNEFFYSLTQRLYLRAPQAGRCGPGDQNGSGGGCSARPREFLTWQVGQKYFLDPDFGGAVLPGRRNVLATSLELTGVTFLEGPRPYSPIISRLRARTGENLSLEWDLDYDSRAGRIGASNLFADYRRGQFAFGLGHFTLVAPDDKGIGSGPSRFNQVRPFVSLGSADRLGLSAAATASYDYQAGSVQHYSVEAAYNWNCCGISVEYGRFSLGSARDENLRRYSFTLKGIGTAGNLHHAERLF